MFHNWDVLPPAVPKTRPVPMGMVGGNPNGASTTGTTVPPPVLCTGAIPTSAIPDVTTVGFDVRIVATGFVASFGLYFVMFDAATREPPLSELVRYSTREFDDTELLGE